MRVRRSRKRGSSRMFGVPAQMPMMRLAGEAAARRDAILGRAMQRAIARLP